jgi:hypothetical protein
VEAVHRHRVLSTTQIAALFFPAAGDAVSSACRTRLRHLTNAGYLERAEQLLARSEGRRPYLYFLTRDGTQLLVGELGYAPSDIDWKPSYNNVRWPFLAHQIAINDAFVTFSLAAARVGWSLDQWVDDRFLRKAHTERVTVSDDGGGQRQVAVVPDAYFSLSRDRACLRFFLEIDRATMAVAPTSQRTKSWRRRIRAYQAFFSSQAMVERYKTRKVRVLTVTTGRRRLLGLQEATQDVGGRKRYWFVEAERLTPHTALSEPVWSVASVPDQYELLPSP